MTRLRGITGALTGRRRTVAATVAVCGAATAAVGIALVYLPAGVIAAGAAACYAGLFLIDVKPGRRRR